MVVGSLGSVDVYGVPTTSYSIDGTILANYTAPVIDPGFFQLNVTFFTSPTLTPGKHTLVITNLNGTSPNVYWLDYIRFSPSPDTSPTTSVLSTTSTPSSTTSVQASTTTSNAATQTGGNSLKSKPNAGAIAGGIVGGVALVVIVGLLVWWFRRRRREEHPQPAATDGLCSLYICPFPPTDTSPLHRNSSIRSMARRRPQPRFYTALTTTRSYIHARTTERTRRRRCVWLE